MFVSSRPGSTSLGSSPPGASVAASVCCHVAAGQTERCDELWQAPGVCCHGDRGGARTDQPDAENPTHSGTKGKGEQSLCNTSSCPLELFCSNIFPPIFQLILELCKGSVRGSVNSQVIQSYLEKLPLTTASTDVSALTRDISKNSDKQSLSGSFCVLGSAEMQRWKQQSPLSLHLCRACWKIRWRENISSRSERFSNSKF